MGMSLCNWVSDYALCADQQVALASHDRSDDNWFIRHSRGSTECTGPPGCCMPVKSTYSVLTLCMQPLLAREYNSECGEESDSLDEISVLRFHWTWFPNAFTDCIVLAWLAIYIYWSVTWDTINRNDTWILVADLQEEHRLLQGYSRFSWFFDLV
jgi:hypothetical protein